MRRESLALSGAIGGTKDVTESTCIERKQHNGVEKAEGSLRV
jgi:hypothetical protein